MKNLLGVIVALFAFVSCDPAFAQSEWPASKVKMDSGNTLQEDVDSGAIGAGGVIDSVAADSGAPTSGSVVTISGAGGITTSASGDTVTIDGSAITGGGGVVDIIGSDSGTATGSTVTIAGAGTVSTSATGSTVTITGSGGSGDVTTSGAAVDDNIVTYNGTSGDSIQDSGFSFAQLYPADTLVDRDGDGNPDFVRLVGDYNGDLSNTLEDIYDAAAALTDTGSKYLRIEGIYDSSALASTPFWDATNLIELSGKTTMECSSDARLLGPSLAFWVARSGASLATRVIANTPDEGEIVVRGCWIENTALIQPFDEGAGFITALFGGVLFDGCNGCIAENNTVRGSPHSAFFSTSGSDVVFRNNRLYGSGAAFSLDDGSGSDDFSSVLTTDSAFRDTTLTITDGTMLNCAVDDWILVELDASDPENSSLSQYAAGWIQSFDRSGDPDILTIRRAAYASGRNPGLPGPASTGNQLFCSRATKHGLEFYTEDGVVAKRNLMEGNVAELTGGIPFNLRGVSLVENSCEDGTQLTCWHEGVIIRDNIAYDSKGDLLNVRGSRSAFLGGNRGIRTGGITFVASSQNCYEAFDDTGTDVETQQECSSSTRLTDNVVQDCAPVSGGATAAGCVRFNPGHDGVVYEYSNLLDGNISGNGFSLNGNVPNSSLYLRGRNIANYCMVDGLTAGEPITSALNIGIDFRWCGIEDITSGSRAISLGEANTALSFEPVTILGTNGQTIRVDVPTASTATMPSFRNFNIDATMSGYSGTYATEALADAAYQCKPENQNRWLITQNASSTSDCTFASGTGASENACYCNGVSWADLTFPTGNDVVVPSAASGETLNGGGLFNGKIRNTSSTNRYMLGAIGTGTISNQTWENVVLERGEGMLASSDLRGLREATEALSNFNANNVTFAGITGEDQAVDIEAADWGPYSKMTFTGSGAAGTTDVPDCDNLFPGALARITDDTATQACTDANLDGILDGGGSSTSLCACNPAGDASGLEWRSFTESGALTGLSSVTVVTGTSHSPGVTGMRGQSYYYDNTGAVTVNLPACQPGLIAKFYDLDGTAALTINPDDADTIVLDGLTAAAGEAIISAGARGDFIALECLDSTNVVSAGRSGTWVEETP